MTNQNIELQALINNKPVKQWGRDGRTFIEAKVGSEYSLKVRNSNSYRVMAVVSVDGINVVSGKVATLNDSGYIIDAFSSVEIKGYRKDLSSVGCFKFTKKKKSYAKEVTGGSTENVGVISIAVFKEKEKPKPAVIKELYPVYIDRPYPVYRERYYPRWNEPYYYGESAASPTFTCGTTTNASPTYTMNCSSTLYSSSKGDTLRGRASGASGQSSARTMNLCASANNADNYAKCTSLNTEREVPKFQVGSSWGAEAKDEVRRESFERESYSPMATLELYYDTRENLEEIGIDFSKSAKVSFPQGFPNGFAQPPTSWVG